jgi:hypothetical protein
MGHVCERRQSTWWILVGKPGGKGPLFSLTIVNVQASQKTYLSGLRISLLGCDMVW